MPKRLWMMLILLAAISLSRESYAEESVITEELALIEAIDCDVFVTRSGRFLEEDDKDFERAVYCGRGGLKEDLILRLGVYEAECQRHRYRLMEDLSLTLGILAEVRLDLDEAKKTVKSERNYADELEEMERKLKLKFFGIGGGTGAGVALVVFIILLIAL